ncbi:hypothetical protein AK812_SmicGene10487 [Symbiodinium microadriaticum]|uniref:GOLD domain-containing protein n=1 Tax=Symbiodinium microadriaticum TaxID=2951 RepID=A0A1Q9EFJ0_SYMMI|nr:hypothetical protein AK812_SmicGene10487 [Symbiodinium microadriaticum]
MATRRGKAVNEPTSTSLSVASPKVFSKRVGHEDSEQGRTAYMTQQRGDHRICVQCTGSRWFQTTALKWELSVDMGDTDFSKNPATRGNMKGIERSVLSTMARAEAISAENEATQTNSTGQQAQ